MRKTEIEGSRFFVFAALSYYSDFDQFNFKLVS